MVTVDTISEVDNGNELMVVTSTDDVYRLKYKSNDRWSMYVADGIPDDVVDYLKDETPYQIGTFEDGVLVPLIEYPLRISTDVRQDNVIESHLHHQELLPVDYIDHADLSAINLDVEIHEDGTTIVTDIRLWPDRNDVYFADDAFDGNFTVVDKESVTEDCCN